MSGKKVNIIGAGIAGLATGCYLQMNGYDTEIFEQHSVAGGLCTSWERKGYLFDGCLHWLLGVNDKSAFYKLWNELIDMEKVEFINHDLRVAIELKDNRDKYGSNTFYLYSNVNRLEKYMLDIAPKDEKTIRKFTNSIRTVQKYELPPLIDKAPELRSLGDNLRLIKYIPLMLFMSKWTKVSNMDFSKKFGNPFMKESFELLYGGVEFSLLAMIMQLAYFDSKSAGYPLNGSLAFARKLEESYYGLGGKINFNTGVKKISVKNDIACGIETEDCNSYPADMVISAADWKFTIFDALSAKYLDKNTIAMKNQEILDVFDSAVLISLGISKKLDNIPHLLRFPLGKTLELPDGTKHDRMELHTYNYDPTMAPEGKTVASITLMTKKADYWIDLRKSDYSEYKAKKELVAEAVLEIVDAKLGGIKDFVEVVDIATPATFVRYTSNWKGSNQGWMPSKKLFEKSPVNSSLPGLENFYMVGHWLLPGGGLPPSLLSARNTVQIICKKDGIKFRTKK